MRPRVDSVSPACGRAGEAGGGRWRPTFEDWIMA